MTSSSAEPYGDETDHGRTQQVLAEIESGRRSIGLAIAVIAAICLPMLFVATRDLFATMLAASIGLRRLCMDALPTSSSTRTAEESEPTYEMILDILSAVLVTPGSFATGLSHPNSVAVSI